MIVLRLCIRVAVPVHDQGRVIGILKSNMRISRLFSEVIQNYSLLYKPGSVKIARTDGAIVLEPVKNRFQQQSVRICYPYWGKR